ncbi:MAG TPA: hypothetical protein VEV62_06965 [Parafilimonas sp.]|nr:hypothetical protein [Parafilimonas sp.]
MSLFSKKVFVQNLDYIHNNPLRAGLCTFPEEYKYSSASFYLNGDKRWGFISHYEG